MDRLKHPGLRFSSAVLAAFFLATPAADVIAGDVAFRIAAGPALSALREFAAQAQLQLLFDYQAVRSLRTPPVNGMFEPAEALALLLEGTGLTFEQINERTIALIHAASAAVRPEASQQPSPPTRSTLAANAAAGARSARGAAARAPQAADQSAGGGVPADMPQSGEGETQVIVTGSRLITDGTAAPTPVTVVAPEFLANLATSNLVHGLQKLPQFANSVSNNRRQPQAGPTNSGNFLNLRGLGATRTLVLVDGIRVPGTGPDGTVDNNTIPEMLVHRIDVVTGGASAAYGSDAVSGVVNYVIDRNFTGSKGVVQTGISEQGDANIYRVGAAAGGSPGGGRLHLLASAEYEDSQPLKSLFDRPLGEGRYLFTGGGTMANPWKITSNTIFANASFGGVARSGPFAGQQFLPGGVLAAFDPGTPTGLGGVNQGVQAGGEDFAPIWMTSRLQEWKSFFRASYQVTDSLGAWVQGTYANSKNLDGSAAPDFRLGNITIFSGNAFLRPEVQAALGATPSFTLSRLNAELYPTHLSNDSKVWNVIAGLDGRVFGDWTWSAAATHGVADSYYAARQAQNVNFYAAIDAVRDASGNIVCRVTLTNPGLYPGCQPLNLFGQGSPSQAALDYINGVSSGRTVNRTSSVGATLHGKPFATWAGPIAIAVGAEYRQVAFDQTTSADPANLPEFTGIRGVPPGTAAFYTFQAGAAHGSASITERFAETSIPLARDVAGLRALDVDLAGRQTRYSTSGNVASWKLGLSWSPFDDVRIRATRSADIRAPDLNALFLGRSATPMVNTDPHTGVSSLLLTIGGGNPDLQPERAATRVLGAIYTPGWLPGLRMSADYYSIRIRNSVVNISAAQSLNICEQSGGAAFECSNIVRPLPFSDRTPANYPSSVFTGPVNAAVFEQQGVDYEFGYSRTLLVGNLQARLLGTWLMSYKSQLTPRAQLFQLAGQTGAIDNGGGQVPYPKLRFNLQVSYAREPFSVTLSEQYIGSMQQSLAAVVVPENNRVPAYFYTALTIRGRLRDGALEPYFTVNNLFDKQPPIIPISRAVPGNYYPTAQLMYDFIGRFYTAGVRLRF